MTWKAENLYTTRFLNGDDVLEAKTDEDWNKAASNGSPAWSYFNYDSKLGEEYGKLYNWYAISDPRRLAPLGWEIPSDCVYWVLVNFLGDKYNDAGYKMKSITGWKSLIENNNNNNNNNNSDFNSKLGGYREFKNLTSIELLFGFRQFRNVMNQIKK